MPPFAARSQRHRQQKEDLRVELAEQVWAEAIVKLRVMRFSTDLQINVQSCQIARIERLIEAEERSIARMNQELEIAANPVLKAKWLAARNRLRDLRLDLMKALRGSL